MSHCLLLEKSAKQSQKRHGQKGAEIKDGSNIHSGDSVLQKEQHQTVGNPKHHNETHIEKKNREGKSGRSR